MKLKELILMKFPKLTENDVVVKATSQIGVDLHLSTAALQVLPWATEVKNVESLNIWAALAQAEANTADGLTPVLAFTRAHAEFYAVVTVEQLLDLYKRIDGLLVEISDLEDHIADIRENC